MLKQLERLKYKDFFEDGATASKRDSTRKIEEEVKQHWRTWLERLERMAAARPGLRERRQGLGVGPKDKEWKLQERLLTSNLEKAIPVVVKRVNEEIQGEYFCSPDEMEDVFRQVELLHHDLPPEVEGGNPRCLALILTAGWLYWNTYGKAGSESGSSHKELFERRKRTNRLLSKGIEAATIQAEFEERKKYARRRKATQPILQEPTIPTDDARDGILAAPDLLARLSEPDLERRLCVTPLLEQDQIQADSIDLRLGNTFLVTRRTTFPVIDVTADEDEFKERLEQYQRRIYVPIGKPFYIQAGQFILASSLEFISMPRDLAGSLMGRTSWGRLGISVPTTSKVAPGFKGCLTIEIKNLGEAPVPLYPGVRIAQLIVQTLSREAVYRGRYDIPTSTEFSRIYEDAEMEFLREFRPPLVIGVTGLSKSGRSRVVNYLREHGFHDQSLVALRREEMRRSGRAIIEEDEREFILELRRGKGNDVLARLLLERLKTVTLDKIVVEGIERLEEVRLLENRTKFFLIGIDAPFQNRLKWWGEDYAEEPIKEEELRKRDLWELHGVEAEGEESEEGTPNIHACMEKVNYQITNDRDKTNLHRQVEKMLTRIMQIENLYEFDIK
jgi:dCTP deaminase